MIEAIKKHPIYQKFFEINPQILQTFVIGNLLIIGGKYFGFVDISWLNIAIVIGLCVVVDYAFRCVQNKETKFPHSAVNSAIGLCLFLRTTSIPIYVFAAVLAILSKHFIQIKGNHFFNPSYTAIFASIMMFPIVAYVNPLQWQTGSWTAVGIIALLGSLVMLRVGTFAIVTGYFVTFYAWIKLFTSHSWDDIKILFFSGSFFILVFHGLTDPAIIPKRKLHRLLYVTQISTLFFVYRLFINENYSFFLAYFTVNFLEMFFWKLENYESKIGNWRTITQGAVTLIFFGLMVNSSYNHTQKYNGVWPELLTNRCIQPICDSREARDNLDLLTPFFLFEKD